MKFIYSILIFCLIAFLPACSNSHTNTSALFLEDSLQLGDTLSIELPKVGLKNLIVLQRADGYTVRDGEKNFSAYILGDHGYSENHKHGSYLAMEIKEKEFFYDLKIYSCLDFLYLCDVDGDGSDEIIVHQQLDAFGGVGQYLSRIFKVDGEEFREIFNSDTIVLPNGAFDTGFASEFLNGYKLKITNKYVDYSVIIDISRRYAADFFDEIGRCKRDISILCDSFMEFTPKDIDGDGVFEIECLQYVSLDGHADGIGYAKSVLKLNTEVQVFEVVKAEFVGDTGSG